MTACIINRRTVPAAGAARCAAQEELWLDFALFGAAMATVCLVAVMVMPGPGLFLLAAIGFSLLSATSARHAMTWQSLRRGWEALS